MKHVPNELDIKTDLIRCAMASLSPQAFEDKNFKTFLAGAQNKLDLMKERIGEAKFKRVMIRIGKALDEENTVEKRREDLLTAAVLI